jgi:hypothetical protein
MTQFRMVTYGVNEVISFFNNYKTKTPDAYRKASLRVAQSMQMKARAIIDQETIAHTGILRKDVNIKPRGKDYVVVAGEYAPYAYLIEEGRKTIMGYIFIPTNDFPLEGFSKEVPGGQIAGAKGIHFMARATEHARGKSVDIFIDEIKKVTK